MEVRVLLLVSVSLWVSVRTVLCAPAALQCRTSPCVPCVSFGLVCIPREFFAFKRKKGVIIAAGWAGARGIAGVPTHREQAGADAVCPA